MDYRLSHMAPAKGITYDASFENLPYRKMVWGWEKEVLGGAIRRIRQEKPQIRYLDFACGTGRILNFLEVYVDEAVGLDISPSMLEVAARNVKNAKLIRGDATREEILEQSSVDLVTAFRFFLNAQPTLREEALRAIYRILKDEGYLIFNIHMSKGSVLERILRVYYGIRKRRDKQVKAVSIEEIRSLLERMNFRIIGLHHYGVLPVYYEGQRSLIGVIDAFEQALARIPLFKSYSRYVIYICRKRV
jgi:SAM-dependent methyltransferase